LKSISEKPGVKTSLLDGMKAVSFCHYLQGPAAMQYLADMGAEVIKIEPPNGAFERHWAGANRATVGAVSALFLCANRNVRSLAIDLKHREAAEVVFRLIEQSHVLAENFRPLTLDRLGFGYDAVRQRKPDIIYASASGFGSSGPFSNRPGQDLLVQAMSGLARAGVRGEDPVPVGCAAVDQHGAALMALAIAGAYARWLKCREGTRIEATLLGAAIDLQTESIVTYLASGVGPKGLQRDSHLATWYHAAPYGIYQAEDCQVALSLTDVGALAEALKSSMIKAFVGRNAYLERDALAQAVAAEISTRTYGQLAPAFDAQGIWYARVDDYDDLMENPQVRHNGSFCTVPVNGETATLVSHPVRYDGQVPPFRGFALAPGADSRAILSDAGFSSNEVTELIRDKVVFEPKGV
jgi:crotonobetainyl-CoA:carnitine CoA-transferase CaiB-like acyl-CoA transferase